jgi:hypothetical protein
LPGVVVTGLTSTNHGRVGVEEVLLGVETIASPDANRTLLGLDDRGLPAGAESKLPHLRTWEIGRMGLP